MAYRQLILMRLIKSLLIVGVITGCGSSQPVSSVPEQPTENRPEWVTSRPINANYYIGIAVSSKTANPSAYAIEAQQNALNSMASEIEVQVKSNSMLFTFSQNTGHTEEFKEFIQVKANKKIANYEQVAVWENASEYWVYYRLSKAQYQKDRQAEINKSIGLSVSQLNVAQSQADKGAILQAMKQYYAALQPIKPFLADSLPAEVNGSEVFLGNYLFTQISALAHQFQVNALHSEIPTYWGAEIPHNKLIFNITSEQGAKVSNVPVKFVYSEGIIRPRDGVTSAEGRVSTTVGKVVQKDGSQQVSCSVDFEEMLLNGKLPDEIDKLIFSKLYTPSVVARLNVSAPKVWVNTTANAKNKTAEITSSCKSALEVQGYQIASSKKKADILVTINLTTRNVGKQYDLENVLLGGQLKATYRLSGKLIFTENYKQIRGVAKTKTEAANQSYAKLVTELQQKSIPRMHRKYMR